MLSDNHKSFNLPHPRLSIGVFELDEYHCRALGTDVRDSHEIELEECGVTEPGERVLINGMRHNPGPSWFQVSKCCVDVRLLAKALQGNSSVRQICLFFCVNRLSFTIHLRESLLGQRMHHHPGRHLAQ
jgi:hypothetical protein